MKQKTRWLWFGLLVLLLGGTQVACALSRTATPTPVPTTSATGVVQTRVPTAIPPTISATATSAPTATPMPPLPPQVVSRSPARGEELPIDTPLMIRFDQPMNRGSVEGAFSIEPAVAGQLEWADDQTVLFKPTGQFDRQTRYDVTIAESAKSAAGLVAEMPFAFRFQTVGFLEVSQVLPADGTEQVDVDTTITVMFNRPVVPLVHSAQVASLPQPLRLEPAVAGKGEWLNTSIYVFRPSQPMAAGTTYQAIVPAGLSDLTGGVLASDYAWSFTTQAPRILWIRPEDKATRVGLNESISVTFNQPMDRASTEAAFRIVTDATTTPPAGTFSWNTAGTELGWRPRGMLAMATAYTWEMGAGANAAAGQAALENSMVAQFWTVEYPALLFTSPADGETRADPYGGLDLYFASPMDSATIVPNLTILPEPTRVYTWYDSWEDRFYVGFTKQPSTDYTVTVGAGMADPYGNTLGRETVVRFTTNQLSPMAHLNTPGTIGTYNAYTPTVVYAVYRNVNRLDLTLSSLSSDDLVRLTAPGSWQAWDRYTPPSGSIIRQWNVPVEDPLDQTLIWRLPLTVDGRNPLPPGVYYLTMTSPGLEYWNTSRHVLVVSSINLTVKAAADQVLVWATDLVSGQPVVDLPITLVDSDRQRMASGRTGKDGLFFSTYESEAYALYAFSAQPGDDLFSAGSTDWTSGISPWDFSLPYEDYRFQRDKVYLYTDRPIYRPGHTVYFKGILREPDEARYRLPDRSTIVIEAYDWNDTLIYQKTLSVSAEGTFAGEIHLDQDARTGGYHFLVDPRGIGEWVYFQVAAYRKPEYQVEVASAREHLVAGETVQAEVTASYFFGGPVNNARVEWVVLSDSYSFSGPGRYSYQDYSDWYDYWWDQEPFYGYGQAVAEGIGLTDSEGRLTIQLPADLGDKTSARLWTLEATVIDINEQRVTGRTQVVIHPAAQYAGIYADRYVATMGEQQGVNLIAVDLQSEPVAGADVTFVALQREWFNVQLTEGDRTWWEWTVQETPVFTQSVRTGADGRATLTFDPPAGGSYRLRVIIRDDAGRENRASTFLWVSGDAFVSWRMENNDRIELIADRDSYQPGDVAEILIPSPYQGEVQALVTVERGKFFQQQVITLRGNSEIYRLPITAEYAPTVYVSVVLVKGIDETNPLSGFKVGVVRLNVSAEQQALTVTLTPQSTTLGPGDIASYDVLVTDHQGRPVEAELSLALVDLSVLTLAADPAPPILDAFYSGRGLGVMTGVGLVLNVDRLNEQVADKAKGGGGGDGAAMGIGIEVRTEFPDTAYWEAFLRTDSSGRARVEIPLPDSLTTWRLSAKAVTADTRVGQSSVDVMATKPLLIRPVTPRFFVVGDRATLGAVVHNNTASSLDVEVTLAAQGVELADAANRQVSIPAGGRVQVNWNIEVQDVDYAGFIFTARGGGLSDATKPTLATGPDGTIPVLHYSAPDIVGTAGQLIDTGSRTEGILLPPNVDTSLGTLQVEIAPSLAAAMQDGLTFLEHFPYECAEQTVSRFLPNVLTYQALKSLGLDDPALATKLTGLVSDGLQRLYNQQHYDGGWGWWSNSESNLQVTAWVLFGMDKAQEAGFAVDETVLANAQRFVTNRLQVPSRISTQWEANRLAFALYALAERDAIPVSRLETLYSERDKLSHFGKAYLALAYGLLEGGGTSRIDTLLADISGEAILSATGAHWEESARDWWNWNTDTRSTAIILDLLAQYDPENDLAPNVVRWLMVARQKGHWETTQETAWALIALTDWMVATGELDADYQYEVGFNGSLIAEGSATRQNVRETTRLEVAVRDMLVDQVNQLSIGRSAGTGRLYYTAHLETYLPVPELEPIGRGVMVAREYTAASCDPEEETCERITSIALGEAIRVKLTVIAPHSLYYVVVEDPLPAGAEAVDQGLLTSSSLDQGEGWQPASTGYRWGWWGWWWFNQTQVRDDKVILFADYLPAGTYEYTYIMRASLPGSYQVIPTTAREFYFPEVFGRSEGMLFVIEP